MHKPLLFEIRITDEEGGLAGFVVEDFERAEADRRIADQNLDPGADLDADMGVADIVVAQVQKRGNAWIDLLNIQRQLLAFIVVKSHLHLARIAVWVADVDYVKASGLSFCQSYHR